MVKREDIIIGACSAERIIGHGGTSFFVCQEIAPQFLGGMSVTEGVPAARFVVPFVSKDIEKRTNPAASLKNVHSIIVVGVGYKEIPQESEGMVQLSSLGTTEDYHPRVKAIMHEVAEEMGLAKGYKILVDSPALDERALAYRAGLGIYGKNGLVISEKFGSRFNIGCLLTTESVDLSAIKPNIECKNCNACIDACPVNREMPLCVSYLTQKDTLIAEEESIIKKSRQIYGCDICQDVCPLNKQKKAIFVDPQKWLDRSDEELKNKYANTAMLWRGVDILRRNALIHM